MALVLLDTFGFIKSAADDVVLEALLYLDDFIDFFVNLPFELLSYE